MSQRPFLLSRPEHFLDPYYVPAYYSLTPDNVIDNLMRGREMPMSYVVINSRPFGHKGGDLVDLWRHYAASLK